jgi:hypothetical protein
MYATASIATEGKTALVVPRDALLRLGDQQMVFVETGDAPSGRKRFERLPVAVDDDGAGARVPVLHGLDAGARVVTYGMKTLSSRL